MTLPAPFTTSPMGVTLHPRQRAVLMLSLLEWPRSLLLKIPSILASPTVSSSQTHVSTAVYTYWPICCIAVLVIMIIRASDKAGWGLRAVEDLRIPHSLACRLGSFICHLGNSQGLSPAGLGTVGRYGPLLEPILYHHLSTWSCNQACLSGEGWRRKAEVSLACTCIIYSWQAIDVT